MYSANNYLYQIGSESLFGSSRKILLDLRSSWYCTYLASFYMRLPSNSLVAGRNDYSSSRVGVLAQRD
jgi:hypothetical protein